MQNRYEHRNRRKYNLKVHIVLVTNIAKRCYGMVLMIL